MATVVIQRRKGQKHTSYIVRYKDPSTGTPKYYKSFRRLQDAQQAANYLRDLIDNGKTSSIQSARSRMAIMSFREVAGKLADRWKDALERSELRPKTFEEYLSRLQALEKLFDHTLLCEITKQELLNLQKSNLRSTSAVTANRNLFVIKQVFRMGLELRAISEDPAATIRYLSEKAHERNRFLLPLEVEKLVEASRMTKARFYMPALIYLGAEHGASKQEALSLTWGDIRFDYSEHGMIRFYRTKNDHERSEYLMPRTRDALIVWRDHLNILRKRYRLDPMVSDLVFSHADGSPIEEFKSAWKTACRNAGIKNLHFHDLRHTFCSNLILSGADLKNVKEMIGHRDIAMTDRYSHLTMGYKRILQERLSQHYASQT